MTLPNIEICTIYKMLNCLFMQTEVYFESSILGTLKSLIAHVDYRAHIDVKCVRGVKFMYSN